MPLPPLPTRQSIKNLPPDPKPTTGRGYAFENGTPVVHDYESGISTRHDLSHPQGQARFHAHMDLLGTPEAHAMKQAATSGYEWNVPVNSFSNFARHDHRHLADLAAASPGSRVNFFSTADNSGKFGLEMKAKDGSYSLRRVDPESKEIINDSFRGPSGVKGKGWGARAFLRQIIAARRLGIHHMTMDAAAGEPGNKVFNGYYTWPRLGWNGSLENVGPRAKLPPHLADKKTFHDLFDHPEGADYWRDHGDEAYKLHFDARPGSPHVQRLVKYLRSVQARRRGPQQG